MVVPFIMRAGSEGRERERGKGIYRGLGSSSSTISPDRSINQSIRRQFDRCKEGGGGWPSCACSCLPACCRQCKLAPMYISRIIEPENLGHRNSSQMSRHLISHSSLRLLFSLTILLLPRYEGSFLRWGCLNWRQCVGTLDDHVLFKTMLLG